MIELYDGQITDLLRNNPLQYDPEVMAMGYAIREEKRRIMVETAQTLTMAMLDNAPEFVLDVLAVELRTPAYDETLPVETKRTLIKGTLEFYAHLGTPWAVNWVIRSIFGNGKVTDWYEYGGEAHHFRVSAMCMNTSNTNSGGWKNSHMMKTICPTFLNVFMPSGISMYTFAALVTWGVAFSGGLPTNASITVESNLADCSVKKTYPSIFIGSICTAVILYILAILTGLMGVWG